MVFYIIPKKDLEMNIKKRYLPLLNIFPRDLNYWF